MACYTVYMLRIALLRWTNVHDKDVSELNTKLDTQNREEMKILKQKAKDKSELERYEERYCRVKYLVHSIVLFVYYA